MDSVAVSKLVLAHPSKVIGGGGGAATATIGEGFGGEERGQRRGGAPVETAATSRLLTMAAVWGRQQQTSLRLMSTAAVWRRRRWRIDDGGRQEMRAVGDLGEAAATADRRRRCVRWDLGTTIEGRVFFG
jgi:hypothetical protein